MEDKLRLNTQLYGFDGIIGRRDFFLNSVIISAISILFTLPYTMWMFTKIETMGEVFNPLSIFLSAPILLKMWIFVGTLGFVTLAVSNIFRRLNDINGEVNNIANIILSVICLISAFSFCLPIMFFLIFGTANFIAFLVLLLKYGKITSKFPYDFSKEFNWGAFLGTWIWGLFNKSYKTLWIWLIGLTPWGTHYALYCGLKGNEWAFKNKKWNDVDKFNTSQEKQATIFAVLAFLIIPIVYFAIIFGIVTMFMFVAIDDAKNTPKGEQTKIEKLGNALESFASLYFEGHEITAEENKYYVLSSDWKGYSFSEKKDILDLAASMAASEREKSENSEKTETAGCYRCHTKTQELPRTKIYDSETKKLLGEFIIDEKTLENGSFKDIIKAGFNAYHFYNP